METKIKICGIKDLETAELCADLGVNFIGFNFSPVSVRRIELSIADKIISHLKKRQNFHLKIVALFYRNSIEEIKSITDKLSIDFVQYVVKDEFISMGELLKLDKPLIPQLSIDNTISDKDLSTYTSNFVILDSYKKGKGGGTGEVFNWEYIKSIKRNYLLAGGLNPQNVKQAIDFLAPYGVDVASGVEKEPGIKDKELIKAFCSKVRD